MKIKKSSINLAGKVFEIELTEDKIARSGVLGYGFLFIVRERNTDEVGACLSVFVAPTTIKVWGNNYSDFTEETIKRIFLTILPRVPIPVNIAQVKQLYPECLKVVIHPENTGYDQNKKTMYIKGHDSPEKLVSRLIFGGEFEDEQVEKEVLKFLYNYRQEYPTTKIRVDELQKYLFVPQDPLTRSLDFLDKENLVDLQKDTSQNNVSVAINNNGVKYVRSNFKQIPESPQLIMGDQIKGDKITTRTSGDQSPVIVKSSNISVVYGLTDKLKGQIEKDYKGDYKKELLSQTEKVKELSKNKKNNSKIRAILGKMLTRTSEVATIAATVAQLIQHFS